MKGADILNDTQKKKVKNHLLSKLEKINKELESLRDYSALKNGFGTMRLAKKQRKDIKRKICYYRNPIRRFRY